MNEIEQIEKNEIITDTIIDTIIDTITCSCCFTDNLSKDDIITCNGNRNHTFCKICITKFVANSLGLRRPITCMETSVNCKHGFRLSKLENGILDQVVRTKYMDMMAKIFIRDSGIKNFVECYNCLNGVIIPEICSEKTFKCGACNCSTCIKCKNKSHEGITDSCKIIDRKSNKELRQTARAVIICKCGEKFTKSEDGSCNKVTCIKCSRVYCFICGKKLISTSAYYHFKNLPDNSVNLTGVCSLYGGKQTKYKNIYVPQTPNFISTFFKKSFEKILHV